jgi:F0F1-type ATP synthase assembly protein I
MTSDQGAASSDDAAVDPYLDDHPLDLVAVVAIQVVVAVAVWGLLGLIVDLVLDTRPWAQFCGIVIGTMVGLVLAQRYATPGDGDGKQHG